MLERCDAFLIGRTGEEVSFLERFAHRVGFRRGIEVGSGSSDGAAPVSFFLLHHQVSDAYKQSILAAIRGSEDRDIAFAPVVILIDDCACEQIIRYVHWGFDDVISLPEKAYVLKARLEALLVRQIYFETQDYLGPDRRRLESLSFAAERRGIGASFMRYEFWRDPDAGVRIGRRVVAA